MQPARSETNDDHPSRRNWTSFWSLVVLQGQNAFNDKAAQYLLVPLGAWLFATQADVMGIGMMEYIIYILAIVIVLPFILFSPLAGWFSDRYSKTYVIRAASVLQLVVLVWITLAIHAQQVWVAIAGFFILSVQSVMLSPAKRGIVKELVGHGKLGFASGVMEIVVVLMICLGQVITGFWFADRLEHKGDGWDAALFPLMVFSAASLATLLISLVIEKVPAQGHREFKASILTEHFGQIKELFARRAIRLSAIGVAFFWGYAGYLNLAALAIPKEVYGGASPDFARESALLMLAASVGVFIGGAVASVLCKRAIELGLVPLGGVGMVAGTLALAMTPMDSDWLKLWFVVAGAGGAFMLVPLNAHLQDLCPPEKRGKILAGLNLVDCMAGLAAALIQLALVKLGVAFKWQFIALAVVCVLATRHATRLLPQHVLRVIILTLVRIFYRMKILHADRMPREGGVLLISNHVSYIDAFVLSAASPRKVRFLMFDAYFKHRWIGPFVRLFDTVPISNNRAKEAMRVAAEALEEGSVVCIFPEGQLARTGVMNEFKRGFEMIARKANCPVLPVAMDGVWGSIFSFERNKFIYKWPYRVPYGMRVAFGDAVEAGSASAGEMRQRVLALRSEAFALRREVQQPGMLLSRGVNVLHGAQGLIEAARQGVVGMDEDEQKSIAANAVQMGEVNAVRRKQTVMIEWDGLEQCRDVLVAFVQYFGLRVVLVDADVSADQVRSLVGKYDVDACFSGNQLAARWQEADLPGGCYDFSGRVMEDENIYACYTQAGRVISMSMPHPAAKTATNQHQDGYLIGAWGRLLPGFAVEAVAGEMRLRGPAVADGEIVLTGKETNVDGILMPGGDTTS